MLWHLEVCPWRSAARRFHCQSVSQSLSWQTTLQIHSCLTCLCCSFFPLLWGALRAKCAASSPPSSSTSQLRRRSNVTEEYIWIHLALQAICSLLPGFSPHKFCLTADFHSARSEGRLVTFECLPDWLPRRHSLKCNVYYASSAPLFFDFLFHFLICAGISEPRQCFFILFFELWIQMGLQLYTECEPQSSPSCFIYAVLFCDGETKSNSGHARIVCFWGLRFRFRFFVDVKAGQNCDYVLWCSGVHTSVWLVIVCLCYYFTRENKQEVGRRKWSGMKVARKEGAFPKLELAGKRRWRDRRQSSSSTQRGSVRGGELN